MKEGNEIQVTLTVKAGITGRPVHSKVPRAVAPGRNHQLSNWFRYCSSLLDDDGKG